MLKRFAVVLSVLLIAGLMYGCSTSSSDSNPNMSETPASAPAGTTDVTILGGSVNASGSSIDFDMTMTDQDGNPLTNVTRGNLTVGIYDDASASSARAQGIVAQVTIDLITSGSNTSQPIAAGLTLDKSGSMWGDKVKTLEAAATKFVNLMANNSQAAIINFDSSVSVEAAMTSNKTTLIQAITVEAPYGGSTAIFDAISAAIDEVKDVSSTGYTRAIIAMTDGQDNASLSTEAQVTAEAIARGLPIYTIGLFADTWEANSYRAPLVRIAESTVGTSDAYYEVVVGVTGLSALSADQIRALGTLEDIYTQIGAALASSYSLQCSLSAGLTSGQTYWLRVDLEDYTGSGVNKTAIKQFVAQ